MNIQKISDTITVGQAKIIIELLTEIKDELKEIKGVLENQQEEENETYTCDNCNDEGTGEPYKSINRYTFCSETCFDEWSDSEN